MRITSIVKNAKTVDNLASKYWILHELISTLGEIISHTINKQTHLTHCMIDDFILFVLIIYSSKYLLFIIIVYFYLFVHIYTSQTGINQIPFCSMNIIIIENLTNMQGFISGIILS